VEFLNQLRNIISDIRFNMRDIIQGEISSVEREYIFGIFVLALLFLISPLIVVLIRNAVHALQIFSSSVKGKVLDLKREKRRAERLIYRMLPKSVADSLKSNEQTSEMFESATVCFTEIDGFKDIARSCSPLELFDLLNIIYKTFDARIDSYDVYKVETINDSYMVASGLPERNGDRHPAEIANLCLDLILITPGILIPHDGNLRLKIRIGIHTGATTAGVVGSKMPRYCLFGDTVNVASRMQSTGEPMKIQITYETKMLLDNLGGYVSDMRGQVEVKGKGLLDTYWLVSKA
jgi:class 3 adenylate cyclase